MPVLQFPNPRETGPEGLVAVGGDLHPDSLRLAYRQGIFPWPISGFEELPWFCPPERGVLFFAELHVPRSLRRAQNRGLFHFTIDRAFEQVIARCQKAPRPGQDGTWLTEPMQKAYVEMHRLGLAHSAEAWQGEKLVGGIYGVEADGAFGGESMFHTAPDASKLALLHLIDHLKKRGLDWIDIQTLTPHMERLGAREIPRDDFLNRLSETQQRSLRLFP